jgi:GAF domain-containing protein
MSQLPLDERTRLLAIGPVLTDLRSDAVLDRVITAVTARVGAPVGAVTIALSRVLLLRAAVGMPPELQVSRAISRIGAPCDQCVREGRPVIVTDGSSGTGTQKMFSDRYGVRSYATVPVRLGGQVVGTVVVADRRPRAFDESVIVALSEAAVEVEARFAELSLNELDREDDSSEDEMPLIESAALSRLALARRKGTLDEEHFERGLSMLEHMEERHFKWQEMVAALRPLAQPIDPMESCVAPRSIMRPYNDEGRS